MARARARLSTAGAAAAAARRTLLRFANAAPASLSGLPNTEPRAGLRAAAAAADPAGSPPRRRSVRGERVTRTDCCGWPGRTRADAAGAGW